MLKGLKRAAGLSSAGTKDSATTNGDDLEVIEECWENQRYTPFGGWAPASASFDRPAWSNKKGDVVLCREAFLLPVGWVWTSSWNVEPHKESVEGWYYASDFKISTKHCSTAPGRLTMVRRRKWLRTRNNCKAEMDIVANVRRISDLCAASASSASPAPRSGSGPSPSPPPAPLQQNSKALSQSFDGDSSTQVAREASTASASSFFIPDFCFRYATWTNTACYGFTGASAKALDLEQRNAHESFYRLQHLLSELTFFGGNRTANATGDAASSSEQQRGNDGDKSPMSPAMATRRSDAEYMMSPSETSPRNNTTTSTAGPSPSSPKVAFVAVEPTADPKSLSAAYKYGVAPVLRRHLWVRWSGAAERKAAQPDLFKSLVAQATEVMRVGHSDGVNEMLGEIMQDVVRTAPRHPFFEHSQVVDLLKTPKTNTNGGIASPVGSPSTGTKSGENGLRKKEGPANTSPATTTATATTSISGAIANNAVTSYQGGFANDNSGAYRLALTLLCLALYEADQIAFREVAAAAADNTAEGAQSQSPGPAAPRTPPTSPHGAVHSFRKKVPEYHQAFSYIAAVLLLNMPEEEAFWVLVCVLEDFLPQGYHDAFEMHTDLRILTELTRERLPTLDAAFQRHQIDVSVFASGWLQGLLCAHFPFPTAARVLDIMFAEGNSSIFVRFVLAFLKLYAAELTHCDGSCGAGQLANQWAREVYDISSVLHVAIADQKALDLMSVIMNRREALRSLIA